MQKAPQLQQELHIQLHQHRQASGAALPRLELSLVDLQFPFRLHNHIATVLRHCSKLDTNVYHVASTLQANMASRAATPEAVLLAIPGAGLPGALSRQVSGVAGQLECSWSGVVWEVEGNTQQVSWLASSGTSVALSRNASQMEGASSCA